MGILITPTRTPSHVKSPEGDFPFLHGENFLRFFPEPFSRAITATITIATTTAIVTFIIITTTTTAISGTAIKIKAFCHGVGRHGTVLESTH